MSRVFLDEAACDIDEFLGVAVGVCDLHFPAFPHEFEELLEESDVGASKGKDGLPVVADGYDFCAGDIGEGFREIEALTGDVLELVDDDVFVKRFVGGLAHFTDDFFGIVNHVGEVDLVVLL